MEFGDETTIETYFKNTGNPQVIAIDPHNLIGNFNLCKKLYKEIDKLRQQISNLKIINNSLHQHNINEEKYIKEINDLKSRLSRYENNIEVNLGDLVVINFESGDGQIRRGIQCMKNEIFAIAEEKLYKFYEAFRDTNNKFTVNEIEIKRFKTIEENNIKDGDIVVLETI
jgi:predicted RNase H-like nuclease (RuvC/YqgF family)